MKKDNPGIKLPPPLYYILLFFLSIYIQRFIPLNTTFFQNWIARITGIAILIMSLVFIVPSIFQFIRTKNTVVTILPAKSLITNGIYRISRNPMYLGLIIAYTGTTFITGNWWCVFFLIILFLLQNRAIIKEEKYLVREFGQKYLDYMQKVRRWL